MNNFRVFTKLSKIKFCMKQIFENSIIHKPSPGLREIPQKFGPDRFSRFDVSWIKTSNQTRKVYIYHRQD